MGLNQISMSRSAVAIDVTSIIYNIDDIDDLYQSYAWPLSCEHEQKAQWACINALMGTVDRCGYGDQRKSTICNARGLYPSI